MLVPLEKIRTEIRVSNSRFLATIGPADSVEEARAFIAAVRAEFPDATHNVPAYIIGGGNSITEFCSDDGEPAGTSGRPLLAVLKGSGLGNVVIVISRWFGGTLLGTGGLVKAYGDAGKAALALVKQAELVKARQIAFSLPYQLYEKAKRQFADFGISDIEEVFLEEVGISAVIPESELEQFAAWLRNLASGSEILQIGKAIDSKRAV